MLCHSFNELSESGGGFNIVVSLVQTLEGMAIKLLDAPGTLFICFTGTRVKFTCFTGTKVKFTCFPGTFFLLFQTLEGMAIKHQTYNTRQHTHTQTQTHTHIDYAAGCTRCSLYYSGYLLF